MNYGIKKVIREASDWVHGLSSKIVSESVNIFWPDFLPVTELQYDIIFDTMGCASFSLSNVIETQVNAHVARGKFTAWAIKRMTNLGILVDGKLNASDRVIVVGSGTDTRGNTMQNVINFVRKNGLVAEKLWPFTPDMTRAQYFSEIPERILEEGRKMKWIIKIAYEWVITDLTAPADRAAIIRKQLEQAPLWAAIPICPGYNDGELVCSCNKTVPEHCIELAACDDKKVTIGDQYPPAIKELALDYPFLWVMKVVVTPVEPLILPRNLYFGCVGEDVKRLQAFLGVLQTGFYGLQTTKAVGDYQSDCGITPTYGYCGPKTRAFLGQYDG